MNHKLICARTTISARINGTEVASIQDNAFREGHMEIAAGTLADVARPSEARFRNLIVTQR